MNFIYDLNNLYKAYLLSKKNSAWKTETQRYEMNWLTELSHLQNELLNKSYQTTKGVDFILNERGKIRRIVGNRIKDRIVRHTLCDNILSPAVDKYLIYDNGASRKGRGITFTRKRLLKHLRNYYHHNGSNGYILLMDFSKYYDNIQHSIVKEMFKNKIDSNTQWLLNLILKDFEVDVSYMSDTEYSNCMHTCYNSIESPICNQGKRYMPKSVNIGDQTSQIIGIYYPHRIDNYIKIVRGIKYYGRYMDDSYIISNDKKLLNDILKNVISIADELGIFINKKKTQIYKLSKGFRFLQNYYALTETGRVIIKIKPKRLTSMRRKMKRIAVKIINGQLTADVLTELFKSWYNNYYSIMSEKQRDNICKLYNTLTEKIKDAAHSKR